MSLISLFIVSLPQQHTTACSHSPFCLHLSHDVNTEPFGISSLLFELLLNLGRQLDSTGRWDWKPSAFCWGCWGPWNALRRFLVVSLCCIVCLQILRSLKRVKGNVEAQTILQLESCICLQNAYQYVFSHTTSGTWNIKASLFSSCPTKRHKRRKSQILEHFSHKAHSWSPASSVPAVTRYNWQQRKSVWSDQNTKRKSQLAQRGPLPRPLLLVRASWPFPAQSAQSAHFKQVSL